MYCNASTLAPNIEHLAEMEYKNTTNTKGKTLTYTSGILNMLAFFADFFSHYVVGAAALAIRLSLSAFACCNDRNATMASTVIPTASKADKIFMASTVFESSELDAAILVTTRLAPATAAPTAAM